MFRGHAFRRSRNSGSRNDDSSTATNIPTINENENGDNEQPIEETVETLPSPTTTETQSTNESNSNNTEGASSATPQADGVQVPEGIDPSFLAALPEEMRDEVIAEHLR